MQKYPTLNLETIEKLVDMLGGLEGLRALERGDLMIMPKSRRQEVGREIELLSVTSDGTLPAEWIGELRSKGIVVCPWAKESLQTVASSFQATTGVTSRLVILKEDMLFRLLGRNQRVASMVARQCGWVAPSIETVFLLCKQLSLGDLYRLHATAGLWVMHRPIKFIEGNRIRFNLVGEKREIAGPNVKLSACDVSGEVRLDRRLSGYVFELPDPM